MSAKGTCLHEVPWQVREPNDGAYSQRPTTTAGNAEQAASDHDVDRNKRQHSQPHGYPGNCGLDAIDAARAARYRCNRDQCKYRDEDKDGTESAEGSELRDSRRHRTKG